MTGGRGAVVVGSLHYDIVVAAPHRPAAGETVTGTRWHPAFGGKGGNQAAACVAAGVPCRMVSAVGDDGFGAFLRQGLAAAGVDARHVAVLPGVGSGMSVAILDAGGDYGAVIVSGANLRIDPAAVADPALWEGAGHLVLQNEVPEAVNIAAAAAARARGIEVVLNAAPARALTLALAALVDILIVNAGEAEALCGIAVTGLASAGEAARALAARFRAAVVTAGGAGMALAAGGLFHAEPAPRVTAVSTHGAGDCFIGTLVAARAGGQGLVAAAVAANRAAAAHVARLR